MFSRGISVKVLGWEEPGKQVNAKAWEFVNLQQGSNHNNCNKSPEIDCEFAWRHCLPNWTLLPRGHSAGLSHSGCKRAGGIRPSGKADTRSRPEGSQPRPSPESPGSLLKGRLPGPIPKDPDSEHVGWGPGICGFKRVPWIFLRTGWVREPSLHVTPMLRNLRQRRYLSELVAQRACKKSLSWQN